MKKCCKRVESLYQEIWNKLYDSLTERYGFESVSYEDVVSRLTDSEKEQIWFLSRYEQKPMRDILDVACSYLAIPTPKDEWDLLAGDLEKTRIALFPNWEPVPLESEISV